MEDAFLEAQSLPQAASKGGAVLRGRVNDARCEEEGAFGVDDGVDIGNAAGELSLVNVKNYYCRCAHFQCLDSARIGGLEASLVACGELSHFAADNLYRKEEETHLRPWRLEQRQEPLQWQSRLLQVDFLSLLCLVEK